MTNSSDGGARKRLNIPPPPGSKAAAGSYSRIIPREELGSFAAWQPGALGPPGAASDRRRKPREPAPPDAPPSEAVWRERMAEARKLGYQDGYRDGLVGLENFKQAHASQSATQVGMLLGSLDEQWTALEPTLAQAVARTAVLLARRVLRQELQTRPQHIVGLAQEAIGAVMHSARRIELHVHPDDVALVEEGAGELLRSRHARLVADAQLVRGGCRVQSDLGTIEASIEARWREATRALGSELDLDAGDGSPPDEAEAAAADPAAEVGHEAGHGMTDATGHDPARDEAASPA